jgi:hypothetical protein
MPQIISVAAGKSETMRGRAGEIGALCAAIEGWRRTSVHSSGAAVLFVKIRELRTDR